LTSIYLYKRDGNEYTSYRYEISNIERLDIQKSTPVSAMPLPMEDSSENILVKMEGNSEVIQMTWRIPEESAVRIKTKTGVEDVAINQGTADDDAKWEWGGQTGSYPTNSFTGWASGNPVKNTAGTTSGVGSDVVNYLLSNFEGRDIEDEFYVSIPEMDAREGWLSQLNATISGDSPVVWTVSATFQVGRVISIYDMDSPSEPRDVTVVPSNSSGGTGGTNTHLRIRWVIPIESGESAIIKYVIYSRPSNSDGWMELITDEVADFTSGGNLQYVYGGTSGETYEFKISARNVIGEGMKSNRKSGIMP